MREEAADITDDAICDVKWVLKFIDFGERKKILSTRGPFSSTFS